MGGLLGKAINDVKRERSEMSKLPTSKCCNATAWVGLQAPASYSCDKCGLDCGINVEKIQDRLSYAIELDGDSWFAHYSDFTNLQDSSEYAIGRTPQEALQNFIDLRVSATLEQPHDW